MSPSDLKHIEHPRWIDPAKGEPTLMLFSVVDDRSGVAYQEYHCVYGEDAETALRFLFNSMAPKADPSFPFQGRPKLIYLDNGPVAKRRVFQSVMRALGIEWAEQILALFDGIGQGDSPRGRLRIGAVNTAQTGLLPEVLKRLAEQAPHIEPQVVPGVSLHLLDQVDAAELDLAILIRPPFNLPRGLSAQRVERQPFVLIAPPQCTATDALELLRTQPFIRYDHVSFGGRLVGDFLEAQQLRPRQVMELDEIDAIARMVENGLGVALLPRAGLWLREPARVRVIELGALEFQRELVMVSRSGSAQDDLVGEFRRALLAETAAQEAAPTTA